MNSIFFLNWFTWFSRIKPDHFLPVFQLCSSSYTKCLLCVLLALMNWHYKHPITHEISSPMIYLVKIMSKIMNESIGMIRAKKALSMISLDRILWFYHHFVQVIRCIKWWAFLVSRLSNEADVCLREEIMERMLPTIFLSLLLMLFKDQQMHRTWSVVHQ